MKHETSSRLEESGSMGLTETIAGPLSRVHKVQAPRWTAARKGGSLGRRPYVCTASALAYESYLSC